MCVCVCFVTQLRQNSCPQLAARPTRPPVPDGPLHWCNSRAGGFVAISATKVDNGVCGSCHPAALLPPPLHLMQRSGCVGDAGQGCSHQGVEGVRAQVSQPRSPLLRGACQRSDPGGVACDPRPPPTHGPVHPNTIIHHDPMRWRMQLRRKAHCKAQSRARCRHGRGRVGSNCRFSKRPHTPPRPT
jgi:hypothetical protein